MHLDLFALQVSIDLHKIPKVPSYLKCVTATFILDCMHAHQRAASFPRRATERDHIQANTRPCADASSFVLVIDLRREGLHSEDDNEA